jgi:hypothetical protein
MMTPGVGLAGSWVSVVEEFRSTLGAKYPKKKPSLGEMRVLYI